ncbi:NCA2-domain-containing protein [Scleroderma citrinum]
MSFRFSAHYVGPLFSQICSAPLSEEGGPRFENALREIDAILTPPFSAHAIQSALDALRAQCPMIHTQEDKTYEEIQHVLVKKVVLGLYAGALDLYLCEASSTQDYAEWWAVVEQSVWSAALYLLQTLPHRLFKVFQLLEFRQGARQVSVPYLPSLVTPSSSLAHFQFDGILHVDSPRSALAHLVFLRDTLSWYIAKVTATLYYPIRLAREECHMKRRENERICNERAEVLGKLLGMRPRLSRVVGTRGREEDVLACHGLLVEFASSVDPTISLASSENDMLSLLEGLFRTVFIEHKEVHSSYLSKHGLRRPSRLTILWPKLLFLPPLILYCVKTFYASRETIIYMAKDAFEASRNFLRDWLLEPLHGVYRTIRTGGDGAVLVRPESVAADLDSLERMSLALARDKLGYDQEQLSSLSRQIRLGDFTPVLRLYEEDIKSPVKSVLTGNLLRTLFVQVQKAKVDIDQALAGIDKLLKSQELTFAFVGVAPAFAIVYTAGGVLGGLFSSGRGRYGSRRKRRSVWLAMRRIERLLLFQPISQGNRDEEAQPSSDAIPPLTSGLLVLSLTHLRNYALTSLPPRSRLREGFLEDVQDLEDPSLGRWEKLRVLDRMWKNWAHELGWHRMAGESAR